jgi:nucleoside-diphosphate-sugar epimerase
MSLVHEKFGWRPGISLEEGMRRVYERARIIAQKST